MSVGRAASSFDARQDSSRGITNHYVLTPKRGLLDEPAIRELHRRCIPAFLRRAGVRDFSKDGMRLVVENPNARSGVEVHLISGRKVSPPNPQEWRTPKPTEWDPARRVPVFEACAEIARNRKETHVEIGDHERLLYYTFGSRGTFGLRDDDPKAHFHALVIPIERASTPYDSGFTSDRFLELFVAAGEMLDNTGRFRDRTRYVLNYGRTYQTVTWMHMHVLSSSYGLPSMFPSDLGFVVADDGTISAPTGSIYHRQLIRFMEARSSFKGFTLKATASRMAIDMVLFETLRYSNVFRSLSRPR